MVSITATRLPEVEDVIEGAITEEIFADASGPKVEILDDAAIEKTFLEKAVRIVVQRNDFLLPSVLDMIDSGRIDISPLYQRRLRWDQKKRSKLIESFLVNVPVPPVFLYETEFARYEVMDGQQRLSTLKEFFNNQFELADLEILSALNGRRFHDLPAVVKAGLERRSLSAVVLLTESTASKEQSFRLRQAVFERLNTGGVRLNPQEVRNCLQSGPFNDLIRKLARSDPFTTIWGIPPKEKGENQQPSQRLSRNPLYMRMADNELVLRFFALMEPKYIAGGLKQTLDSCMERYAKASVDVLNQLEHKFMESLALAYEIFGLYTFRLPPKGKRKRGKLSAPLYDAVMVALARLIDRKVEIKAKAHSIAEATAHELTNEEFYALVVGRANTKTATVDRANHMEKLILKALDTTAL